MDDDLSHAAIERFESLEQRVTALEQAAPSKEEEVQVDLFSTPVEEPDEDEE